MGDQKDLVGCGTSLQGHKRGYFGIPGGGGVNRPNVIASAGHGCGLQTVPVGGTATLPGP